MSYFFDGYRGRTAGRVFDCIGVYCESRYNLKHEGQLGSDGETRSVHYRGRIFATYSWPNESEDDRPIFTFYNIDKPDRYRKGQAYDWTRRQFIFRPYIDDDLFRASASYVVQELRASLSLTEALWIKSVRDERDGNWDSYVGWDELFARVDGVIAEASHGYLKADDEMRKHLLMCAIYEI